MSSELGAVITYAVLTLLWGAILGIYVRQRRAAREDALIGVLLAVLILDAFRTVVESIYFGLFWGAAYGVLPESLTVLQDPAALMTVKLLNVGVAVVVLVWLVRRWIPAELAQRAAQRKAEVAMRVELEQSLALARESEERFQLAAKASGDCLWDLDIKTGKVTSTPKFAELLGYSPEEWPDTAEPWMRVIHPDDRARMDALLEKIGKGEARRYEGRHRVLAKDGRLLHVLVSSEMFFDEAQRPTRFVGFTRDITALVEEEEARVQIQKLESLGLLAGGIAHDFNNLLTVVSASLELANRQSERGQPVTEAVATAALAVQRATTLTRQLLAYAGRGRLTKSLINLNGLVDAIGELLSVSVSRRVKLERSLATDLPAVLGDEGQLQQVVMNLITNAGEAIGDREGTVRIQTEALELKEPPPNVVGEPLLGRVVRVTVTDTGSGMSPEVRARIFDPFFSTKGSGRGLGLAALSGILRSHGGAIGLETELGKGSSFSIFLPAAEGRSPMTIPSPAPSAPRRIEAHVLLVDDEPLLLRSAGRLLRSLGCTVEEANTGAHALERVKETPKPFDAVLMDVTMPVMDGFEAARQLSVLAPQLPVILSSGYSDDVDATLPPGVRTLSKPYDLKKLEAVLREALAARLARIDPS